MAIFRMLFRQPGRKKIKTTFAALGANIWPPARPVLHQTGEPQQAHNVFIGRIFQQAQGCPILIKPPKFAFTRQDLLKLLFADVVIPDVGGVPCGWSFHIPLI